MHRPVGVMHPTLLKKYRWREMKLFRFEKFSHDEKCRLDTIRDKKIFLSAPKNFNDLNDCNVGEILHHDYNKETFDAIRNAVSLMGHNKKHKFYQKVLDFFNSLDPSFCAQNPCGVMPNFNFCEIREFLLCKVGVCCFSEEMSDLMWAYYGGSHHGYCVEYEVDLNKVSNLKKVCYSTERENISIYELLFSPANTIWRMIGAKDIFWQHEKEWRIYDFSGNVVDKTISLPNGITQVRIITGQKISEENKNKLKNLGLDVVDFNKINNR